MRLFSKAAKVNREALAVEEKLAGTPARHGRIRSELARKLFRLQVRLSQAIREVPFSSAQWAAFRTIDDKAVALIEFLPGVSVDHPEAPQARAVGAALAGIHQASADFAATRANALGPAAWRDLADDCGQAGLAQIDPELPALVSRELDFLKRNWPESLPHSVIHADLFPDNVLMLGTDVSGLIDFYFACNDITAYDLAVTHAAWCFAADGSYRPAIGEALVEGYNAGRPLPDDAWAALPILARGAAMRFLASRAYDWLHTPADALVTRKDPLVFAERLSFYEAQGETVFRRPSL